MLTLAKLAEIDVKKAKPIFVNSAQKHFHETTLLHDSTKEGSYVSNIIHHHLHKHGYKVLNSRLRMVSTPDKKIISLKNALKLTGATTQVLNLVKPKVKFQRHKMLVTVTNRPDHLKRAKLKDNMLVAHLHTMGDKNADFPIHSIAIKHKIKNGKSIYKHGMKGLEKVACEFNNHVNNWCKKHSERT